MIAGFWATPLSKSPNFSLIWEVSNDKIRNGVFDARNTPRFVF